MEAFLLWTSGIAWGVRFFFVVCACINIAATILACFTAAVVKEEEEKKDAEKIAKKALAKSIACAITAAVFPPENTWLGWLEMARRP